MFNIVNIFLDCFIYDFHGLGRCLVFSTTSVLFDIMMIHKHGGQYGDNSHIVGVAHVMPLYLSLNLLSQAGGFHLPALSGIFELRLSAWRVIKGS
jgi:hypothetical protein